MDSNIAQDSAFYKQEFLFTLVHVLLLSLVISSLLLNSSSFRALVLLIPLQFSFSQHVFIFLISDFKDFSEQSSVIKDLIFTANFPFSFHQVVVFIDVCIPSLFTKLFIQPLFHMPTECQMEFLELRVWYINCVYSSKLPSGSLYYHGGDRQ